MLAISLDVDGILAQLDGILAILTEIWNSFLALFSGDET